MLALVLALSSGVVAQGSWSAPALTSLVLHVGGCCGRVGSHLQSRGRVPLLDDAAAPTLSGGSSVWAHLAASGDIKRSVRLCASLRTTTADSPCSFSCLEPRTSASAKVPHRSGTPGRTLSQSLFVSEWDNPAAGASSSHAVTHGFALRRHRMRHPQGRPWNHASAVTYLVIRLVFPSVCKFNWARFLL